MEVALRAVNLICADAILTAAQVPYASRPALVAQPVRPRLVPRAPPGDLRRQRQPLPGRRRGAGLARPLLRGRRRGRRVARPRPRDDRARRLERHVLADGLDHEGSLRYHALVLELLLVAQPRRRRAAPRLGRRRCGACSRRSRPWPGRTAPCPPSATTTAAARWRCPTCRRTTPGACSALGASLLGVGEEAALDEPWALDAAWLAGPDRVRRPAAPDRTRPRHLAAGGVVVLGNGLDHVVVDVGPIGFRGLGGHGHVDALSFEARLHGHLVVPDSGTGTYTRDPSLRNRLRDAPAHTVVVVDDLPYARIGDATRLWAVDGDARRGCSRSPAPRTTSGSRPSRTSPRAPARPGCGGGSAGRPAPSAGRTRSRRRPRARSARTPSCPPERGRRATTPSWPAPARSPGSCRRRATLRLEDWRRSSRYDSTEPGCRAVVEAVAGAAPTRHRLHGAVRRLSGAGGLRAEAARDVRRGAGRHRRRGRREHRHRPHPRRVGSRRSGPSWPPAPCSPRPSPRWACPRAPPTARRAAAARERGLVVAACTAAAAVLGRRRSARGGRGAGAAGRHRHGGRSWPPVPRSAPPPC